mmetsp:Transcript_9110/g.17063  ORF Transcript_9110/g.17063 Transcript_9110/m.17063 type:complete len:244 (-) Transcript_9110:315-1046(-)
MPAPSGSSQNFSKKVAIFGLSADPPTGDGGHAGVVQQLASMVDEVWVIPVYKHMFANKTGLADYEHRVRMCELAFQASAELAVFSQQKITETRAKGEVKVCRTEQELVFQMLETEKTHKDPIRCGSIDVIRHLQALHPEIEWSWALGADTYLDLRGGKWKDGEEFQQLVRLIVIPRAGHDMEDLAQEVHGMPTAQLMHIPSLTDVSSSRVRASKDENYLSQALCPEVVAYIKEHKLYAFSLES